MHALALTLLLAQAPTADADAEASVAVALAMLQLEQGRRVDPFKEANEVKKVTKRKEPAYKPAAFPVDLGRRESHICPGCGSWIGGKAGRGPLPSTHLHAHCGYVWWHDDK